MVRRIIEQLVWCRGLRGRERCIAAGEPDISNKKAAHVIQKLGSLFAESKPIKTYKYPAPGTFCGSPAQYSRRSVYACIPQALVANNAQLQPDKGAFCPATPVEAFPEQLAGAQVREVAHLASPNPVADDLHARDTIRATRDRGHGNADDVHLHHVFCGRTHAHDPVRALRRHDHDHARQTRRFGTGTKMLLRSQPESIF